MNIEELIKIEKIEDYKNLGSVQDFVVLINAICKPLSVNCETYEEIEEAMNTLKQKWTDFLTGPFINKQEEYIFYLTVLDGEIRNKCLGVTDEHYENKNKAKSWYKHIAGFVHPDKSKSENSKAFIVLKDMYENMIDYEEGDQDE